MTEQFLNPLDEAQKFSTLLPIADSFEELELNLCAP